MGLLWVLVGRVITALYASHIGCEGQIVHVVRCCCCMVVCDLFVEVVEQNAITRQR